MNFFKCIPVFFLIILSCSDSSTNVAKADNRLWPLTIGNKWQYNVYDNSGKIVNKTELEVTGVFLENDAEYAVITVRDRDGNRMREWLAKNESDGLVLAIMSSDSSVSNPLFLKYPVASNERYEYKIPDTDSVLTMEVKRELLNIDSVKYDCYAYFNHNIHSFFPIMDFSENIGLIRHKLIYMRRNGPDSSRVLTWELDSFFIDAK